MMMTVIEDRACAETRATGLNSNLASSSEGYVHGFVELVGEYRRNLLSATLYFIPMRYELALGGCQMIIEHD